MYWCEPCIVYCIITILMVLMVGMRETISDKRWMSDSQDLSVKIDDDHMMDKTVESYPFNEGFILLSNNDRKSLPLTLTSADSSDARDQPSPSMGHLTRRSLNESNDDTDLHALSVVNDNESEIEELGKQLSNNVVAIDGSGSTIEPTSEMTTGFTEPATTEKITVQSTSLITHSTAPPTEGVLSGNSTFLITVDCIHALAILTDILSQLNKTFFHEYSVYYNSLTIACARSSDIDVQFTISTSDNIIILTNLLQTLQSIVLPMKIELKTVGKCQANQIVVVKNVTACYLIDQCSLCGINPRRGVCLPEKNVSKCQCFVDPTNPFVSYVDEFCKIPKQDDAKPTSASWVPIVIGVLGGIVALLCLITSCLLVRFIHRRRSSIKDNIQVGQFSSFPRARIPTLVTNNNVGNYSILKSRSISDSLSSFAPDQKISGNSRTVLTNIPSEIAWSNSYYDSIYELDAIIDSEDESGVKYSNC